MIRELVSPGRAIAVWTVAALASIMVKLFLPSTGADLSYLKLPYFIGTYAIAALLQGVVFGLAIRGYLWAVNLLFKRLEWTKAIGVLFKALFYFPLFPSAVALIVLPEGRFPESPMRAVLCAFIAFVALYSTAPTTPGHRPMQSPACRD